MPKVLRWLFWCLLFCPVFFQIFWFQRRWFLFVGLLMMESAIHFGRYYVTCRSRGGPLRRTFELEPFCKNIHRTCVVSKPIEKEGGKETTRKGTKFEHTICHIFSTASIFVSLVCIHNFIRNVSGEFIFYPFLLPLFLELFCYTFPLLAKRLCIRKKKEEKGLEMCKKNKQKIRENKQKLNGVDHSKRK